MHLINSCSESLEIVSTSIKCAQASSSSLIVIDSFEHLEFVGVLPSWTLGGQLRGFWALKMSLLDCFTCMR